MEEINKKTLIESLSSLPEHEPPEQIWEAINEEMSAGEETLYTRQQLRELPSYEPAAELWSAIESKLPKTGGQNGKIISIGTRRVMAVAASLGLLLAAYWLLSEAPVTSKNVAVTYSTETVDNLLLQQDWNEDEDAFEQFHMLCDTKKYICEHPEFVSLKSELDELTEAKFSIQEAIGSYGTNANLVTQIKEIELERTDILKKMMVMLI